jgi:hypothetical protein
MLNRCHAEQVSYAEQVSCYAEQVSCYAEQVLCYAEQVSCYAEQVLCYAEQVSCYAQQATCYAQTVTYVQHDRLSRYVSHLMLPNKFSHTPEVSQRNKTAVWL